MKARSSRKYFLIVGITAMIALTLALVMSVPTTRQDTRTKDTASENRFWTYEYKPLRMRVTIGEEWTEIPTASLALPQDITGARFAFQKKGTSCVLVYTTATEDAFRDYINITNEMRAAGKITSANVLNRVYNDNLLDTFSIDAYIPRQRLSFLTEQYESGTLNSGLSFHDGGIVFVSSHFTTFKESSRQTPVLVLFEDGTGSWDGWCLRDMVKVVESIDRS